MISQQTLGLPVNQTLLTSNLAPQVNFELYARITNLEGEVRSLANAGDKSIIKYADLGFKTLKEAGAWLGDNFKTESDIFGYLLDFHMMMQHISSESSTGHGVSDENVSKRMNIRLPNSTSMELRKRQRLILLGSKYLRFSQQIRTTPS